MLAGNEAGDIFRTENAVLKSNSKKRREIDRSFRVE